MRILYVSHADDCFLGEVSGLDIRLETYVDKRSLETIFSESERYACVDYDLCIVHPENPFDAGYARAPVPCILCSYEFREEIDEWVVAEKVVRISGELLRLFWPAILRGFERELHYLPAAIHWAFCGGASTQKPNADTLSPPASDRHKIANRIGPRLLAHLGSQVGAVSPNFTEAVTTELRLLERHTAVPDAPVPLASPSPGGTLFQNGRVLLFDDEHRRGWSTVLGGILGLPVYDVQSRSDIVDGPGLFALEKVGDSAAPEDVEHAWRLLGLDTKPGRQVLPFDLVLADYRLKDEDPRYHDPECVTGTHLIRRLHTLDPSLPVIVVTASESYKTHRQLSQYNIIGYYVKPHETADDGPEFQNFLDMVDYVRNNAYLRDLWELAVWTESECPSPRPVFCEGAVPEWLGLADKPDPGDCVRTQMLEAIIPAITFMFREQRNVMAAHPEQRNDPERLNPLDVLVWCMFRMSHASDGLVGPYRVHERLEAVMRDNEVWLYTSYICRAIRNLVAHQAPPFLTPHDLLLQALCIHGLVFADPIPEGRIKRLAIRYDANEAKAEMISWKELLPRLGTATVPAPEPEKLREFIEQQWKGRTTQALLHGCYLGLLKAIDEASKTSAWERLVARIITRALVESSDQD